jgi:uncharacterized membrane protein
MPTTQPLLSFGDKIALGGVVVAIIGVVVSIYLFRRSRRQSVEVKWENKSFADHIPGGNRLLVFDVTCTGVPIYNVEVCLYIDARNVVRVDGQPALVQTEVNYELFPHVEQSEPLNLQLGQSMKFDLSLRDFTKNKEYDQRNAIKNALMQVDYQLATVRVYCNGRRKILYEIKSKQMKGTLDWFYSMRHMDPSLGLPLDFDADSYDAGLFDNS